MLDDKQLQHFQERQAASLMDTCHHLVYSESQNAINEVVATYTENNTDVPCGLKQSGNERSRKNDTVVQYDATIRLTLSERWNVRDRIKITKRFGVALATPLTYDIVSPAQEGPSGLQYLLRKVNI